MEHSRKKAALRLKILAICLFVGAAVLLGLYLSMTVQKKREAKEQEQIRSLYGATAAPTAVPAEPAEKTEAPGSDDPAGTAEETPTPAPPAERTIAPQYEALYAINQDLVGWITAGDLVDGPVVQKDNSYYLHRDLYGKYSTHGTILLDEANTDYENDPYLVLYGHQFSDKTMFSGLREYRDIEYYKKYPLAEFGMLYEETPRQYAIFAVLDVSATTNERNYLRIRCFKEWKDPAYRESFLADIQDRSYYSTPIDVNGEDKILCMITCSYFDTNGRLLVYARALREGETPESIQILAQDARM